MPNDFLPSSLLEFFNTFDTYIIGGVGGILLLVLFLLLKRLTRKKEIPFTYQETLTSPELILVALNLATAQRQPFELQAVESAPAGSVEFTSRPILQCVAQSAAPSHLTVEAYNVFLSARWLGKTVNLSFKLENKGKPSYYTCLATIREISSMDDRCQIVFDLPERIDNRQQRSFLRIAPPEELIYGAALWHGDTMPEESKISDLQHWLKPTLFYLPGSISQFSLADLSANGVQLFFPKSITEKHGLRLSTVDRFILLVDLYNPEKEERQRMWLQCKAQRIALKETSNGFFTGAQFIAWGKPHTPPSEETPGLIDWFRVPTSREVEPLSNWIMHRHLDNFRLLNDNDG